MTGPVGFPQCHDCGRFLNHRERHRAHKEVLGLEVIYYCESCWQFRIRTGRVPLRLGCDMFYHNLHYDFILSRRLHHDITI